MPQTVETDLTNAEEARREQAAERDRAAELHNEKSVSLDKQPRSRSRWLAIAFAAIALAGGVVWWVHSQSYESTDDAQVDGHLDLVSARITGTVAWIDPHVENNQFVKAGTLLMQLDPRDYAAELEHAKANLDTRMAEARATHALVPVVDASAFGQLHVAEAGKAEALANVDAERANLLAAQHKLQQDEAIHARAERDRVRHQALVEEHEISRSEYDTRETAATAAAEAVEADRAAVTATERKVAAARSLVAESEAKIEAARSAPEQTADARANSASAAGRLEQARADLHTAELNLSYTKIYAPVSGVIGRKTVELGHRIQPGQSLLAIVPLDDIWITANFKETQLRRMRPGQRVTIRVDTFGRDYQGRVESLAGAAGPLFSLFPPENATGNYVKVVERFPVRIRLDKDQDSQEMLRPGMSVEPTVKVR
jgi:membrane fusion protein (multidrug efflux system)